MYLSTCFSGSMRLFANSFFFWGGGGGIVQRLQNRCPRFESQHSRNFLKEKMVDLVEVNQRGCIEESGQWHDNINRTHLVMASGKLVLQNKNKQGFFVSYLPRSQL